MSQPHEITLRPVGVVRNGKSDPNDDRWGGVVSAIELDAGRFTPDALAGLEAFSHVEVVFCFHALSLADETVGARRPRGNPEWPLAGIFAQRGSPRPNRIGVTRCRLLAVEGLTVTVEGLDALNGSPVLDIKPWFAEFSPRGNTWQPEWVSGMMGEYWDLRLAD